MVDFDKGREKRLKWFECTGGAAHGGMTVRDCFAAEALAALIVSTKYKGAVGDFVSDAYTFADAMMKEREKPVQKPTPTVEEAFGLDK